MKTIFILYMPGHAGHMLSRLFGLSDEAMPLVNKSSLNSNELMVNKLDIYQFSNVKNKFRTWQDFHRGYVDYKDNTDIRIVNAVNGHPYSSVIYPIHPYEFHCDYQSLDKAEFYYVDLDLNQWGSWVSQQQQELKFACRPNEQEYFENYKQLHDMKPINLTRILGTSTEFEDEYLRVVESMKLTPALDRAIALFSDWSSVRLPK